MMNERYPSEAGWFYRSGLWDESKSCVSPSLLSEKCGSALDAAAMGFEFTDPKPVSDIVEICKVRGYYLSYENPRQTIFFCKESYDRWVELYG